MPSTKTQAQSAAQARAQAYAKESLILSNQAAMAISRSQRLVASWFPGSSVPFPDNQPLTDSNSTADLFPLTQQPELLGVGAPTSKAVSETEATVSQELQKLRRQFGLARGKALSQQQQHREKQAEAQKAKPHTLTTTRSPSRSVSPGRTATATAKQQKPVQPNTSAEPTIPDSDLDLDPIPKSTPAFADDNVPPPDKTARAGLVVGTPAKVRPRSYLDQVLAEKEERSRRKKRRKEARTM